jgi:hypothetical protein
MVSLKSVAQRFYFYFDVIEGGTGRVRGLLTETEQQSQPSYVFVQPRHVFRAPFPTPLRPGMVIRANSGDVYIVGENGPSEQKEGTLWQSFRLFEATSRVRWKRRKKVTDSITNLERDDGEEDLGLIWAAVEPLDRELMDREIRHSFEQKRIIVGRNVKSGDLIDNRPITKVDTQLGLRIGIIT